MDMADDVAQLPIRMPIRKTRQASLPAGFSKGWIRRRAGRVANVLDYGDFDESTIPITANVAAAIASSTAMLVSPPPANPPVAALPQLL